MSSSGASSRIARVSRLAPAARALRFIELLCIVCGVALLGLYAAARFDAVVGRAAALEAFEIAHTASAAEQRSPGEESEAPNLAAAQGSAAPDQSLWAEKRITAHRASISVVASAPLGVLAIPKIGLRVPVFEGATEFNLNRGVARIGGTAAVGTDGNLGIAGHRDGFFRGLEEMTVGDAIDLQAVDGADRYRVTELLIVRPDDVYVLDPTSRATLTLVTCYPFYFVGDAPQRFIVKAVVEGAVPI